MCKPAILVDIWPKSKFVSVDLGNRIVKPDLAFQRYTVGKDKPHYPVPVTSGTAALSVYHKDTYPAIWPFVMVEKELGYIK